MQKILIFGLITIQSILGSNAFSQNDQRMGNHVYTQTRLMENFESKQLNRNVWNVVSGAVKDDLYMFVDSLATVNQNSNQLDLSMIRHPGYSTEVWSPEGMKKVTVNFISGEIATIKDYSYGIFECNATLAYNKGSFPAFWLYSDARCDETERPEIDIVELKVDRRKPTLDNNIWYYPVNCLPQTAHEFENYKFTWGGTHTFKSIWTPQKIEFWVDSIKLKEVINMGQYWYPQQSQHVILSQQIIKFGIIFRCAKRIITPQTSSFNWVKVREFFLAPEITCPDNIEISETATLDVDPEANNITWELTPQDLFSGEISGNGTEAEIIPASYRHSTGKIIFKFEMPSGESFSAEKVFTLNGLH